MPFCLLKGVSSVNIKFCDSKMKDIFLLPNVLRY